MGKKQRKELRERKEKGRSKSEKKGRIWRKGNLTLGPSDGWGW